MGFLKRLLKRRAIGDYARRLPRLLARDYGASRTYTPAQVRSTIERGGLDPSYSCYGIAMFSSRESFDNFHAVNGEQCNYDDMRSEIATDHFGGNIDFSFSDILSASGWDGVLNDGGSHGGGEQSSHGGADSGGHSH
jgi:hypothetical protein